MRFRQLSLLSINAGVVIALTTAGCTGRYQSDFQVLVVNRTADQIQALADGNAIGSVEAGQTGTFTLTLAESGANIFNNGVAPTPQAKVTLTAKDTRTGALSSEKDVTLTQNSPTTVSFAIDDFPDVAPTVARFSFSPTNPTINQDVNFNGSASTASNGVFVWDFGDGTTGSGVSTTHRYTRGGTFTIVMTVTSDNRQTSTASKTLTASTTLAATTANFTFSPTSPSINQDIVFTANAAGATPGPGFPGPGNPGPGNPGAPVPGPGFPFPVPAPGNPTPGNPPPGNPGRGDIPLPGAGGSIYLWDFGDGTQGVGTSVTHHYSQGSTYTVTLRVTTDAGLTATSSRQVTVSATLPAGSANFVFSPTDPRPDDVVFFNASSSTITNGTYKWDFGDGNSGSGVTVTHSYSAARTYTVTLTVTSDLGQRATTSKTITVSDPQ